MKLNLVATILSRPLNVSSEPLGISQSTFLRVFPGNKNKPPSKSFPRSSHARFTGRKTARGLLVLREFEALRAPTDCPSIFDRPATV